MAGLWEDDEAEPLPPTNYYVLYSHGTRGCARISSGPKLPPEHDNWMTGQLTSVPLPSPLLYEIDPDDEGILRPFYGELGAPLMSDELLAALSSAGVDNLEIHPALVRENGSRKEHKNYKAVNIIGLVSGADMTLSKYTESGLGGDAKLDLWFEKLVLDESKLRGFLMFRLAENVAMLLVHRTVMDAVKASGFAGLQYLAFAHPGEYTG